MDRIFNMENLPFSAEAFEVFAKALQVLTYGMLGIFIFMSLFYTIIKLLEKYIKEDPEQEQ